MNRPFAIALLGSISFTAAAVLAVMKVEGWGWFMLAGFMLLVQF